MSCLSGQRLEDGLVFYAPFDGSTVNLVGWEKPDNHGVRFVADRHNKIHQAVAFNGISDFLSYAAIPRMGTQNVSLSVWLKTALELTDLERTDLEQTKGESSILYNSLEALGLADGTWHHLVLIRHEENQWEIWIDQAAFDMAASPDFSALLTKEQDLSIGAFFPDASQEGQYYKGSLDELRLYNRKLTVEDIRALYQEGSGSAAVPTDTKRASPGVQSLQLYPNPTSRMLQVRFESAAERRIFIIDEQGRQIRYLKSSGAEESINVAGLLPGSYVLQVQAEGGVMAQKFIKTGAVLP